ncbi:hypothetical protein ARALYDRAFT_918364 [Arabidopsis lyrata subsp. lyrata]|uniref:P-type Ca(2+) transporter n=1 Tax=Arabidopsis lyrata subsp. lyrata TaxID=81972 RepID=D7MSC2_ARALL|nr:hypothetical protein ARALYDRAFT_918364 [Arabidopsis lyrata subsp. lyrata]
MLQVPIFRKIFRLNRGKGSAHAAGDASGDSEAAVENAPPDVEAGRVFVSTDRRRSLKGTLRKVYRLIKSTWKSNRAHAESASVHAHPQAEEQQTEISIGVTTASTSGGFEFGSNNLAQLLKDRTLEALNRCKGVPGLATLLKTDLGKGIDGHDDDLLHRRQIFGSNTYPCKKGKRFWRFIWKACQFPPSLLITLAAVIQSLLRIKRKVTRGGGSVWVSIYDIVVGDIVPLKNGGQVQKDLQKDPFLLSGSKLIEGIGTMLVTSVGKNTQWGKMMETAHETDEEMPFQVYLKWITNSASCLAVLFALVACIVQLCRYFYGQTKKKDGNPMFILGITTANEATEFVLKSLSFGIATIIVGVAVGLSIAVLLNLAITARKMLTDNALMSVVDVRAGEIRMQDMDGGSQLPTLLNELIIEGIAQNTNGSVVLETGVSGREQAMLSFAGNKLGMKFDDVRSASLVRHTIPFNPDKKYGGVALELSTRAHLHWKGSANIILNSCEKYIDGSDNPIAIDELKRKDFEETIKNMCMRGLRCAALAYRPYELEKLPTIEELSTLSSLPGNLVLLAIIGIEDPCRQGTKEAIQLCKSIDVKVCMVTDDDVLTATAIAKECGIFDEASDGNITTGAEFRNLSSLERTQRAEYLLVLAQSSPRDNLLFVKALKERGHVVAATGMGIHDSETLMAADVSLAMGIRGTAAAKEKSDIIVLDDKFATIVEVIRWCRYLYTNIQKHVLFRLTVSVSVVAICVVEVVFYDAFPLNTVQLLLLNLIIDIFGALSLVYRPPANHLMAKPPVGIRDPLINKTMWAKLVLQVIYVLLFLAVINSEKILKLMHGHNTSNAEKVKNTFIFNCFIFCLAFGEFEIGSLDRTLKEILRDNMFVITIASTIVFQASPLYKFTQHLFSFSLLTYPYTIIYTFFLFLLYQIIFIEYMIVFISPVKLDW